MLQTGLAYKAHARVFRHAADRMIETGESFHGLDTRSFQLLHLSTADVGDIEQAVLGLPDLGAMVAPTAKTTICAGYRTGWRGIGHEPFEPRPRHAGIGGVVRKPKGRAGAVPQFDVCELGRCALNFGQQIRIKHQLQHMLGVWPPLQLGVGHLVAERAKRGGSIDALQEIRPAAPVTGQERALKYHIRTHGQRGAGRFSVVAKSAALDLDDGAPNVFEVSQMGCLVGVALFLQQCSVFTVFPRLRSGTAHMGQIQGRRVGTPHEAHEIRGGEENTAVEVPHECSNTCDTQSPRESPRQIAS